MRTDYFSHDGEYRKRKAQGRPGWDDDRVTRENIARFTQFVCPHLADGDSILELGCGAGNVLLAFVERGYRGFGVDISPAAIAWAKENAELRRLKAEFFVADVTREGELPIEPVAMILDGHCLHCIIGDDRARFLANAHHWLRPGGKLHIQTMCGDGHKETLFAGFDPETRCILTPSGLAVRYLGRPEDILNEVSAAGFTVLESQVIEDTDIDELVLTVGKDMVS
jgi:SAM-dependent methyltransferase